MKVGRGSIGPMSKVHRKCTSCGRSPLLCTAILIVLGVSLVLAGCGQMSLTDLLENEEPGEFRVNLSDANLSVGSTIDISATGGFKPYTFSLVPSSPGTIESDTGIYTAPPTVSTPGGFDPVEIEATDFFGRIDLTKLNVFEPLSLNIKNITVTTADTVDFTASGGVAPYSYYLDDVLEEVSPVDSSIWTFPASPVGTYIVEVLDDIENSAVAKVEVIADELAIVPTSAYVVINETTTFSALNPAGAITFSVANQGPGTGWFTDPGVTPAQYNAPAVPTTDTVILTDTVTSVTATVHVLASDPDPFVITPSAHNPLGYGDEVVFIVSGGVPPYTFWLEYSDAHGSLEQIAADKARYTAPDANTVDWVWVADELDTSLRVKVRVNK